MFRDKLKNRCPSESIYWMLGQLLPTEDIADTEENMRPVPPGGRDKSPPQSRPLPSRMLSDPEGVTHNLPKGHTSSSSRPLSLLTPYSLQSSLTHSQEVHIVHGERLRSTFLLLIRTHISNLPFTLQLGRTNLKAFHRGVTPEERCHKTPPTHTHTHTLPTTRVIRARC